MKLKLFKKLFFVLFILLYQNTSYSKTSNYNDFNQKYLSDYFSALVSYDNQNNEKSIKFFNSSKNLLNKHDKFLKEYIFSLVEGGQIDRAIRQIKNSKGKKNSDFFEANLLLVLESLSKKKYKKTFELLNKLKSSQEEDSYEYIIYETLRSYNVVFFSKKNDQKAENFGKLSLITRAFQNCYINPKLTKPHFFDLINSDEGDYSRYLFFYISNFVENKEYDYIKEISLTIDTLSSSLLISQAKKWIDDSNYENFNEYFSCKNHNDILSEFFFLISNLYSSQEELEKSNFYLNIANYLNPKFYFNLTLLIENYFEKENYKSIKNTLEKFNEKDEIYDWYKTKKLSQILSEEKNDDLSLQFIEKKFRNYKTPSPKILFDMGNIYKQFKKYPKSIEYYTKVLSKIDKNSSAYAETLYRRGGSYERVGDYRKADKDLLKSLEIIPDEPYFANYLAYSWLERNYNIDVAIKMLEKAYKQKKNDPYIIDSVGWGYYLIGDYINAEKYLKKAIKLMPDDPIVNDHYADILWKLNRKLQAQYLWERVLNLKDAEDKMKNKIKKKLLIGPDKI